MFQQKRMCKWLKTVNYYNNKINIESQFENLSIWRKKYDQSLMKKDGKARIKTKM